MEGRLDIWAGPCREIPRNTESDLEGTGSHGSSTLHIVVGLCLPVFGTRTNVLYTMYKTGFSIMLLKKSSSFFFILSTEFQALTSF